MQYMIPLKIHLYLLQPPLGDENLSSTLTHAVVAIRVADSWYPFGLDSCGQCRIGELISVSLPKV